MAYQRIVPKGIEVVDRLVKGLGIIVDTGERKLGKDGQPVRGMSPWQVASDFYCLLEGEGHPLAKVRPYDFDKDGKKRATLPGFKYVDCSTEKPCGACRRCVYMVHQDAAEKAGLIHVQGFAGKKTETRNGRQVIQEQGRGYVWIYRPGEMKGGYDRAKQRSFIDKVRASLG